MTDDIDLVYLWCDMADPAFRAKRNETLAKWGKSVDLTSNADCRAIARDELRFSLRSAEMYAPWIRRVFIVMNDESTPPGWLRTDRPDLCVVKLSEILPPEYLPCYCSDTIEHFIARIPGLAKRFLYANDDMMFVRPTEPSFFFDGCGRPVCRFASRRKIFPGDRKYTTYHACIENSERLVREACGRHGGFAKACGRSPHHNIDAYDRDDMLACFGRFKNDFAASDAFRFPFRSRCNFQRILYSHYALATGRARFRLATFNTRWDKSWWRRLLPSRGESLQLTGADWRHAAEQLRRYRPHLLCMNDGMDTTEDDRLFRDNLYARLFPAPSSFERTEFRGRVASISYTTHSDHLNYGAILHTWAFQTYLARFGISATAVDYMPRHREGYSHRWPVFDAVKLWRHPLRAGFWTLRWLVSASANLRKVRKVNAFFLAHMRLTRRTYRECDLVAGRLQENGPFDAVVCESDVIWKKRDGFPFDRGFLLDFPLGPETRKVAYAPSLSDKPLAPGDERRLAAALRGFHAVSSRERRGAECLSRLLGREVPWVIDPTLLLDASDYVRLARRPPKGGFVLLYTCMKYDVHMIREARRYARRMGRELVEVGNYGINRLLFGHRVVDDAGVEEWLGLMLAADAVICNSFHGICFSVLFHKPFYAFLRGQEDGRFTNICEALGLEKRLVAAGGGIPGSEQLVDYESVEKKLTLLRKSAESYLRESLL